MAPIARTKTAEELFTAAFVLELEEAKVEIERIKTIFTEAKYDAINGKDKDAQQHREEQVWNALSQEARLTGLLRHKKKNWMRNKGLRQMQFEAFKKVADAVATASLQRSAALARKSKEEPTQKTSRSSQTAVNSSKSRSKRKAAELEDGNEKKTAEVTAFPLQEVSIPTVIGVLPEGKSTGDFSCKFPEFRRRILNDQAQVGVELGPLDSKAPKNASCMYDRVTQSVYIVGQSQHPGPTGQTAVRKFAVPLETSSPAANGDKSGKGPPCKKRKLAEHDGESEILIPFCQRADVQAEEFAAVKVMGIRRKHGRSNVGCVVMQDAQGTPLNSPAEAVKHRDGSVWFTDNQWLLRGDPQRAELPNSIYRYDNRTKHLKEMYWQLENPHGICFAPNYNRLYVADGFTPDPHREWPSRIRAFKILKQKRYGPEIVECSSIAQLQLHYPPACLRVDSRGYIYAGCFDGVRIFHRDGRHLGTIYVRGGVIGMCFTGPGQLFVLSKDHFVRCTLSTSAKAPAGLSAASET